MGGTRQHFDKELVILQEEILRMGSLVEQAIYEAVQSLARQDANAAQEVIKGDDLIDKMEDDIEDLCLKLIATQQPMAKDLRKISTGFKIISDLERMGDHAVSIAKITLMLANQPLIKPLVDIPRQANITQEMVRESLDAYVRSDIDLAKKVIDKDDEVDNIYGQIFRELLTYMMEDPRNIKQATSLLFVSRNIERIADLSTNIGERIIFLVTGRRKVKEDNMIP
jgi:phosphate transport system protein